VRKSHPPHLESTYELSTSIQTTLSKYLAYLLSKKSIKHSTIARRIRALKSIMKHGIDLNNADAVVTFLNMCNWTNGSKDIAIHSYKDYLRMIGIDVELPRIRIEDKLPFVPLESEIDSIISSVRAKVSVFLRILKETACRPIEGWRIKWLDIEITNKCLTITPAKYSKARKPKISEQTLNMLLALPRRNEYVFSPSGKPERFEEELEHFTRNYQKQKNRIAIKLQNPRLRLISLRTFRHWKGTIEYLKTKDIIYVQQFLGHRRISNTLKYIHLANAITNDNEQYLCKVARDSKEAVELIEKGFEFIATVPSENLMLFRKRK